jgi:hypothetical protein
LPRKCQYNGKQRQHHNPLDAVRNQQRGHFEPGESGESGERPSLPALIT